MNEANRNKFEIENIKSGHTPLRPDLGTGYECKCQEEVYECKCQEEEHRLGNIYLMYFN